MAGGGGIVSDQKPPTGMSRAEAGRLGGMTTLKRHGRAHFKRIAKGSPPNPRGMRTWWDIKATPKGARLARSIRNSLEGDSAGKP